MQITEGYVRVTEVLSPYNDFSKVPPQRLEEAKIRGTVVHDFCELYALDLLIEPIPFEYKLYFDSFVAWFETYVDYVINAEERIYHPIYKFCGKYDLLCKLKGDDRIVLVDYKTPFNHHKAWQLQSAAYYILLQEVRKINVERRLTLRLNGVGNPAKVTEYTNHQRDCAMFLDALRLHYFFNS